MSKTQNTLLNTPLRSPVYYQDAPRNAIPEQVLSPLPTSRVTVKSYHQKLNPVRLYQKPLQQIPTRPIGKQSLQRFRPKRQQVELLPPEEEFYSSCSQPSLSLHPTPLPSAALPSLRECASSRHDREADRGLPMPSSQKRSTGLCAVPLQKQAVSVKPILAVQHPVKTRASIVSRKKASSR